MVQVHPTVQGHQPRVVRRWRDAGSAVRHDDARHCHYCPATLPHVSTSQHLINVRTISLQRGFPVRCILKITVALHAPARNHLLLTVESHIFTECNGSKKTVDLVFRSITISRQVTDRATTKVLIFENFYELFDPYINAECVRNYCALS